MIKFQVVRLESMTGVVLKIIATVGDFKEKDSASVEIEDISMNSLESNLNKLMVNLKDRGLIQ